MRQATTLAKFKSRMKKQSKATWFLEHISYTSQLIVLHTSKDSSKHFQSECVGGFDWNQISFWPVFEVFGARSHVALLYRTFWEPLVFELTWVRSSSGFGMCEMCEWLHIFGRMTKAICGYRPPDHNNNLLLEMLFFFFLNNWIGAWAVKHQHSYEKLDPLLMCHLKYGHKKHDANKQGGH